MLDPTILMSLQAPMAPARPEVVIERAHVPPMMEAVKRRADQAARGYEEQIANWVEELRKARESVERLAPRRDMDPPELATFSEIIEDLEYDAELRAMSLRRFIKKANRSSKHWFSVSPSLGAISRTLCDRLIAADEKAIEALLEHALYVRAFRSERDPAARGGPTFDDPTALGRYLRQAVAA